MKIEISLVTNDDREIVNGFIYHKYGWFFGTRPAPVDKVFVARKNGGIVGTLAVDGIGKDGFLPVERIWSFNRLQLPISFNREGAIQFDRWISDSVGTSQALFYTASCYSLEDKKEWVFCEMREKTKRGAVMSGLKFLSIQAGIVDKNIPHCDIQFYATIPEPKLYLAELNQIFSGTKKSVRNLVQKGKLVLPF